MLVTTEQLIRIAPGCSKRAPLYISHLNIYCKKHKIDTPARLAMFIAQLLHESGEFRWIKELGGPKYLNDMYDTRTDLGNTVAKDGDGALYCGRGLIQVTGKANYEAMSKKLFGDSRLLTNPDLLMEPEWAVASACQFWTDKKLNTFADKGDIVGCTKKINGGTNHLQERTAYWEKAKVVLGVDKSIYIK